MRHTDNIYNDLEMYKHREIYNLVDTMCLNSTTGNINIYDNNKITLKYELIVKLGNELDQREYKFNSLYQVLNAAYFVSLLIKKDNNNIIQDFKIFSYIANGKNKVIFEDITDNIYYWDTVQESKIKQENEEMKEQLKELQLYKEFIKKFNAEKTLENFKQQIDVNHSKGKFGIIAYNRQLTKQELNEYEMREYYN